MDKQHKNICVYALALFVVAAALIILSSIFQNRITKEREEELKSNLTTNITARLEKNLQQNVDDVTDENTKLKAQVNQDKTDIQSLKNQINDLNKLVADKDLTESEKATLQERYNTMSNDIDTAIKYYIAGRTSSAKRTILNLQKTMASWQEADKVSNAQTSAQQDQTAADASSSATN
jgi:hypothetical protein